MVWSDQLGAKPRHVPDAAELMPDPRARHYWDGDRVVGAGYRTLDRDGEIIQLAGDAWDVWLLFGPEARWTDAGPPEPLWWEHQLSRLGPERRLEPERFAAKAAEAVAAARAAGD